MATKKMIHGEYNERRYSVLSQTVTDEGEEWRGEEWREEYRRMEAELTGPDTPLRSVPLEKIKEYCRKTTEEIAGEQESAEVGDILYRPIVYQDGSESSVPEGHRAW
jgi:hypothetical protein